MGTMENFYQAPQSELTEYPEANDVHGSLEKAIQGNYKPIVIREVFSEAWAKTRGFKATAIGATVLLIIISIIVGVILTFTLEALLGDGGTELNSIMTLNQWIKNGLTMPFIQASMQILL